MTVAVLLRLHHLSVPVKYDEAFTFLNYAHMTLYHGLSDYSLPNNHLLHTLLVHISLAVFGNHTWALRFPAFLFGCLLVPATYVVARMLSNAAAALTASAFVASSSKLIEYSVNARGYSLMVLLSLALVALGLRLIRWNRAEDWAAFAAVATLGFFTIPTMLYVYSAVLLWLVANRRPESRAFAVRLFVSSLATLALTCLLYLPALIDAGPRAVLHNKFVRPLPWREFVEKVLALPAWLWISWTTAIPNVIVGVLLTGLIIAIVREKAIFGLRFSLALSFVATVFTLMVFQRTVPPTRVLLFGLPLVAIYSSAGLAYLLGRVSGRTDYAVPLISVSFSVWMAFAVLAAGSVIGSEETGSFQDFDEVFRFLNAKTTPDDVVLMPPPCDQPFEYYLRNGISGWVKGWKREAPGKLFIVLRDHHGRSDAREDSVMTLDRVQPFFRSGSVPPYLAFSSVVTSIYVAEGATVDPGFCGVFCFHKDY